MSALVLLGILGGIAVVLLMWGVGIYNKLVELKNRYQNAFSQI
jgi:LemA protein